jgi:hypothetical protein
VGVSNTPSQRLSAERLRSARRRPNDSQGGLYTSRTASSMSRQAGDHLPQPPAESPVRWLHDLARQGRLAEAAAAAQGEERIELTGAAYAVVWPIVYARVTRRFEQLRGHPACAAGVHNLADECLDRFHDDVESVVEDLLAHARQPIEYLEAWIAARLNAATVDGHRRLRGRRGALQRPRLPNWVADGLGHDPWLSTLATEILVWVGVSSTAGTEVWPLEAWAQERSQRTGDWAGSDPVVVAREVETVLAVMRRRPNWYESYVERPLGGKQAPVATAPVGEATGEVAKPLALVEAAAQVDSELLRLAAEAVRAIDARLATGEQAERIVVDVIRAVFGGSFTATLDRAPHEVADPLGGVSGALANVGTVNRIVATVLAILGERRGDQRSA